jgi:hypothetical protein
VARVRAAYVTDDDIRDMAHAAVYYADGGDGEPWPE